MPKFLQITILLIVAMLATPVMADTSVVGSDGVTYTLDRTLDDRETIVVKESVCTFNKNKKVDWLHRMKTCTGSEKITREGSNILKVLTEPSERPVLSLDRIAAIAGIILMAIAMVFFWLQKFAATAAIAVLAATAAFIAAVLAATAAFIAAFLAAIAAIAAIAVLAAIAAADSESNALYVYVLAVVYEIIMAASLYQTIT